MSLLASFAAALAVGLPLGSGVSASQETAARFALPGGRVEVERNARGTVEASFRAQGMTAEFRSQLRTRVQGGGATGTRRTYTFPQASLLVNGEALTSPIPPLVSATRANGSVASAEGGLPLIAPRHAAQLMEVVLPAAPVERDKTFRAAFPALDGAPAHSYLITYRGPETLGSQNAEKFEFEFEEQGTAFRATVLAWVTPTGRTLRTAATFRGLPSSDGSTTFEGTLTVSYQGR